MGQEMFINIRQPEECRIAIVDHDQLEELYVERTTNENLAGNVYKGVIVNIEPGIQAAFVDFGADRNGFLHISDVEPSYYSQAQNQKGKPDRQRRGETPKPLIQDIFQRGDEVIVQVIKEGIGTKGPTLSTYIGIPGRYLVLMPSLGRVGISRKIEDEAVRRKLREVMKELDPPKGLGFIVRTAGADRTCKDLARDLTYLMRLWKVIFRRIKTLPGPVDIYVESDMVIRTIRDMFSADIDKIVVDEEDSYKRAKEFMEVVMPRYADRLAYYDGKEPIFSHYKLEEEIAKIHQRRVELADGGSIVIDQTEALVAIDVNSGSFRTSEAASAEEYAFQMNLRAAKEIARQVRLRDLGGVIVNDFIDMTSEQHRRAIERTLRDAMKRDRSRTKILKTSPFGLIEMTRQRIRPGLKRSIYRSCPCCHGGGLVKAVETMVLEVMRTVAMAAQNPRIEKIEVTVSEEVAQYINNQKRQVLAQLEEDGHVTILVQSQPNAWPEAFEMKCLDRRNTEVPFDHTAITKGVDDSQS